MSCTFFQNKTCEYFPCHPGAEADSFNCMFCYCPLYALGKKCGGDFVYLENGVKDCSGCLYPHQAENYDALLARYGEIMAVARREDARP